MAYNSDGYIMFDFSDVDFRRTTQSIPGLYDRCVKIIGTNKFILVINANGKTPLPSVCSFVNNQYVIESCIYTFAVTSADSLFIRRNDVPASDIIDDTIVSADKTWSSNKIDSELDGKQDTLTAGTNITIDENNVISSTGGAVIDDTVIVNNKVWSSLNTVEKLAPIDTIVNNPATFNTSLELPLVECSTSFEATQEGTGDPSPSNVRTIVGVNDVTITANGVDLVIDLNGARYGGSIDVVNGVAHCTHNLVDLGDLNYAYGTATNWGYFAADIPQLKPAQPLKSDIFKFKGYSVLVLNENYTISGSGSLNRFYIRYDEYTEPADFKTAVTGHYLLFELATPFDIHLTTQQITTIAGSNSIESDTGNIKVSYRYLPIGLF